ncbi:MAG: hypothetical protein QXP01_08840, partial [Candidatus Hadarchaeum sp.]
RSAVRNHALWTGLLFAVPWITACGTRSYNGSSCLAGRYLVVVTPALIAQLSPVLGGASTSFRWLVAFLGIHSVCWFAANLSCLSELGLGFANPYVMQLFHPLYPRLPGFLYDPYETCEWGLGLLWITAPLVMLWKKHRTVSHFAFLAWLLGSALSARFLYQKPGESIFDAKRAALTLEQIGLHRAVILVAGDTRTQAELLRFCNRFTSRPDRPPVFKGLTTRDLGAVSTNGVISQVRLENNDWLGRPFSWATIVPPFRSKKGWCAIEIEGELVGNARCSLALREGSITHVEKEVAATGKIRESFSFAGSEKGLIYVLMRLFDGEGEFSGECRGSLYTESLLHKAGLHVPSHPVAP